MLHIIQTQSDCTITQLLQLMLRLTLIAGEYRDFLLQVKSWLTLHADCPIPVHQMEGGSVDTKMVLQKRHQTIREEAAAEGRAVHGA